GSRSTGTHAAAARAQAGSWSTRTSFGGRASGTERRPDLAAAEPAEHNACRIAARRDDERCGPGAAQSIWAAAAGEHWGSTRTMS
ncbi:MAG: hypothetical protein WB772_00825, partial [Xanthobacteraceae bacterium]